ncbi:AlpA family phage regulatory protein [Mariprofundus sp. NF]|nr:AlpA family phage regulatory protein [Mariprofundus sp. NF]
MYEMPSEGFMRLKQVLLVFPVSKSTWWAGVKSKKYPRPYKLTDTIDGKVTAWRVQDIRALIARVKEQNEQL